MILGISAGITWAVETILLGVVLSMSEFISTDKAIFLAPFVSAFIHDLLSFIWMFLINLFRGELFVAFKSYFSKAGKFVIIAAIIGGPIGMTGYVMAVNYMGTSIGTVATAIYPAIGSVLAYIFLKEKIRWYRWIFLFLTLLGVYGLSYSSDINISNFILGIFGVIMCSFGWGIEGVILAKSMKEMNIQQEHALQIRQSISAFVNGAFIITFLKGWKFTLSLFEIYNIKIIFIIGIAAFFATISYLLYYKAINKIGVSKAMALNITYSAWAVIFSFILFRDFSILKPINILCIFVVIIGGIISAIDYKELFSRIE